MSSLLDALEKKFKAPAWKIGGGCLKCGRCCELLGMQVPRFIFARSSLRGIIRWYYEENFNMIFKGTPGGTWMAFSCPNRNENNLCTIYNRRPRLCREYPSPYSRHRPDLPSYCGFKFLP